MSACAHVDFGGFLVRMLIMCAHGTSAKTSRIMRVLSYTVIASPVPIPGPFSRARGAKLAILHWGLGMRLRISSATPTPLYSRYSLIFPSASISLILGRGHQIRASAACVYVCMALCGKI